MNWPLWLRRLGFGPCPHRWRPAATSKGPARACSMCGTVEQIEEREFYAYFGVWMPAAWRRDG